MLHKHPFTSHSFVSELRSLFLFFSKGSVPISCHSLANHSKVVVGIALHGTLFINQGFTTKTNQVCHCYRLSLESNHIRVYIDRGIDCEVLTVAVHKGICRLFSVKLIVAGQFDCLSYRTLLHFRFRLFFS